MVVRSLMVAVTGLAVVWSGGGDVSAWAGDGGAEWTDFGGDRGNSKYSPLDQLTAENFETLEVAWEWVPELQTRVTSAERRVKAGQFKPTPLAIEGVLYLSTALSQVVAMDGGTGEVLWAYDPKSYEAGRPANLGFQHRGVAYWADGDDRRILITTHDRRLIALAAETGEPVASFGEGGEVDLSTSLGRRVDTSQLTHSSPPGVCRDTIIVGSIVFDAPRYQKAPPGHVRGFDARTGEMKWRFHTIPQKDEYGVDTWEEDSWMQSGAANVWSMFATDEELGYVYMPTGTPTNDMYGGHRPGDNLFAECLICVDAETGERIWHFQAVHHGVWDYDFPTAPNLVDVNVGGRTVKAVAQVSKQAFCYVFDRVTGEPLWPIEERPVPTSDLPGEKTSATQPFPTKPAAYERQGLTEEDLIDFTPELRAAAVEAVKSFRLGEMFTPPSLEGTLGSPGAGGGSNWPGAAVDPESGILYVPSHAGMSVFQVTVPDAARSNLRYMTSWFSRGPDRSGIGGLPIAKPPYSRVTAIDLNTGEHLWMTPHGDGPRDHPLLAELDLPPLGEPTAHGGPLVTKTLLLVTQRGVTEPGTRRGPGITAFDKGTGEIVGFVPLPDTPYGNPVTYLYEGKQHVVVAVGGGTLFGTGSSTTPRLVALRLR